MSIFYLLVPAAAVAVNALTKSGEPALPRPAEITPGVPATEKTIAYRDALLLKQQVEAKVRDPYGVFAAVHYSVSGEALSESELPPASPGFRWARTQVYVKPGGKAGSSLWQYVMAPSPTLMPKPQYPAGVPFVLMDKAAYYARLEAHRLAVESGTPQIGGVSVGTASAPGLEEKDYPKASPGFGWRTMRTRQPNSPITAEYLRTGVMFSGSPTQQQIDFYVKTDACIPRSLLASHGVVSVPDEVWNALKAKGWTEYPPAATGAWSGIFGSGPTLCPPGKKP